MLSKPLHNTSLIAQIDFKDRGILRYSQRDFKEIDFKGFNWFTKVIFMFWILDFSGICGLATAVALHKKGIKSVVMERSESLRNVTGAAIGIRQNGWRALDQLGVADSLRSTAIPIHRERIVSLDDGKEQLISINGEFRALRRKDIIDTLYDALPPATVKFGCQLESIKTDTNTGKPVLRFIDGSSIIAKVVIGRDGGKSVVGNYLNLKPTKMFSLCGVRGFTNYLNGHSFDHEFGLFRKDNVLAGRIPMDDNLVYWFCAHPYVPEDERIWENPELIRSTLEVLRAHPQEIEEMVKNADIKSFSSARLRYRTPWDLLTGTFYKGAVVVACDALHVMGPFLGQGGSAGLEDSVVLARHIAQRGLKQIGNERKIMVQGVGEAFNMYGKQRRMRVVRLSLETYLTGMLLGATSRLKKVMYFVLLSFLFPIKNGHVDYDCGSL